MGGDNLVRERSGSTGHRTGSQRGSENGFRSTGGEHESDVSGPSSSDMEMDEMRSDEEALDDDDDEATGLTHRESKKGRQNGGTDLSPDEGASRSEPDGMPPGTTEEETKKLVHGSMMRTLVTNALLITLWYSFSISISVYNKWMFSKDNLDFHFPLFTTSLHMLVQFSLSAAVLYFIPRFRPSAAPDPHGTSYRQLDGNAESSPPSSPSDKPLITKTFYFTRIGPCGTATALDIGLGNFSLRFISLTFFTMCKSSVLAFVLLFAFLFRLETPTYKLCAIILFMTVGVLMMVAGETAFNAAGFMLVMSASFCSGFRWSLTQIMLLRNRATSNPFSSIFFLTPVMFFALFLLALPIEGPANVVVGIKDLASSRGGLFSFAILLFPGFLAFLMVAAEFALLKRTSVVTLSVCGIFKEVLTISAAGAVFGDELSPINVSGLVVTIASIAAYNVLKYSKMKQEVVEEVQETLEGGSLDPESERQKGIGGHDHRDHQDGQRHSTDALMRDSLHLVTNVDGDSRIHIKVDGVSRSPTKRAEHLE